VGERGRVVDVGDRHLQLLGQVRDLLDDVRERLLDVAHQGRELRPLLDPVGRLLHARDQVGLLVGELGELHALAALDEDAQRAVGHLEHPRHGAHHPHAVELLGARGLLLGIAAGDHHDHPVAAQHVVDQPDRALLPDGQRRERVREGDRLAQR
jgi:hypothetical protein